MYYSEYDPDVTITIGDKTYTRISPEYERILQEREQGHKTTGQAIACLVYLALFVTTVVSSIVIYVIAKTI